MLESMIHPVLSIGALAIAFGAILGFSAKKFAVKVDPRVEQVIAALPGANCGGCGFPGCAVFAEQVVSGEAAYNACPVAGVEETAEIAKLLGLEVSDSSRKSAYVKCGGTDDNIKRNYFYDGPKSCVAASQLASGGNKSCLYACIGLASCKNICPFSAIKMVNSVASIDRNKCTSCGKCVTACPKNLIEIAPDRAKVRVICNSKDKGKLVKENCRAGCIGCRLCEKHCEFDAVTVEDNIAHIDYDKCTLCLKCVDKCPAKAIKVC
ncbi:MAG: RnfABCDGE type electron transport complex subunit B [Defluviitaleaceae bacterium]|nr:RnfABCDGE type electron transport complex subunit B [Defluviitaleaceae bacterium]